MIKESDSDVEEYPECQMLLLLEKLADELEELGFPEPGTAGGRRSPAAGYAEKYIREMVGQWRQSAL